MKLFFALIGLMLACATGLQFYIALALDDEQCADKLVRTPLVAGATLLSSFVPNFVWVYAKRRQNTVLARVSISIWIVLVIAGTTAAGASLGQANMYVDLACHVDVTTFPHWATVALLMMSISLPHAIQKRHAAPVTKPLVTSSATAPVTQTLMTSSKHTLQFL